MRNAWVLVVLLLAPGLPWIGVGAAQSASGEFILRAAPDRIDAIAARHGLTVVSAVEGHPDIFLVRAAAPDPVTQQPLTTQSFVAGFSEPLGGAAIPGAIAGDPDVLHAAPNATVVIPGTAEQLELNGSVVGILDATSGTVGNYFGNVVWEPYVTQPALGVIGHADAVQLATGAGVVIAIIDTGVDPGHTALQGALAGGYDFTRDTEGSASEWADLDGSVVGILDGDPSAPVDPAQLPPAFGHGTMVAGLVHLVAPAATIMPLKAFTADGVGTLFDIQRAIYYAVDHGAKVINMSFNVATGDGLVEAVDYATERGVILVASAGNSGQRVLVYPAGFRNVIGVASTTPLGERSAFSNFGDHLVKVAAPGEGLVTLYPGDRYASVAGTSFSTGLTTGGVGLLSQMLPTVDQAGAGRHLGDGAVKHPGLHLGDGRIDLRETLQANAPGPPPDTIPPLVALTSPTGGATVAGLVTLAVAASDNTGVVAVQYTLDGAPLGTELAGPFELSWNTATASNGVHVLAAVARDAAGNQQVAADIAVTVANDLTAPAVALTAPVDGATVSGVATIGASASDAVGVTSVQFTFDGVNLGSPDLAAPYELAWDTKSVLNGPHVLAAVARDAAGNQQVSAGVTVTVFNDVTPPTITLATPVDGAGLTGVAVLMASASDDVGIAGVQFLLDGAPVGPEVTDAPYEWTWNSSTTSNGGHVLTAVARDAAGNTGMAAGVGVFVLNDTTAPSVALVTPTHGATISGITLLDAVASDNAGAVAVQFTIDGAPIGPEVADPPHDLSWNTASVPNGVHVLSAVARDTAGNLQTAASVTVTVFNDTTAPAIVLTAPAVGTTITGVAPVAATASDAVGVAGVQFTLDGVSLGAEDTVAPYELAWDTTALPNGVYVLAAVARDAAGNVQTAAGVSVTVFNDMAPPTVTFTAPTEGATVTGAITVTADASDDVGVVALQFTLDGVNLGEAITGAPFELVWDTTRILDGAHVLSAIARDAAGNQHAANVNVLVDNVAP